MLVPLEEQEQEILFIWAKLQQAKYPELALLTAIPNGDLRSISVAKRLKRTGTRAGFPDCILPVARGGYHSLAIELKRQKGGRVSAPQREWLEALSAQGWLAATCKGADEAMQLIIRYLNGQEQRGGEQCFLAAGKKSG